MKFLLSKRISFVLRVNLAPSLPLRPGDGICENATWAENATTIAGGNGRGSQLNQFDRPHGLFLDDNQNIYVADSVNDRIVKWDRNASSGQLVAGGNGRGNYSNQLNFPLDVIVDKNGTMYISDRGNERVQRWSLGAQNGQTIIDDIFVFGIAQNDQGSLGDGENQFYFPSGVAVDGLGTVYVADSYNNRVMRWPHGATFGTIIAGGRGQGSRSDQLDNPIGILFDRDGNLYVSITFDNF
ncbi:unnamed protein product [Rotaria sp. Silwood1]|nr:unnamed protein product [Rotaria sp. Silwood1]